jgi:GT2 family glycosyltransferase
MVKSPQVSVIIPTKNRASDLAIAVRSLLGQAILPEQIVIVDQSTDDSGFKQVKTEFANTHGVRLDYIWNTSINGAAAARNYAMERATGDVWLFLDDDVVLEADFIERLLDVYREYPEAGGVSGIITNYLPPPLAFRLWSAIFALGPFHDERQPIYWACNQLRDSAPVPVRKFTSALMSFRASIIRNVRFDANHPGALAEDIDFCSRLPAATLMFIAPRARLLHNRSPLGRANDHWLRAHAQASCYLYVRNWQSGSKNRLCFAWLNVGYSLIIAVTCLKRRSFESWRAFQAGRSAGNAIAHPLRS